MNKRLLSVVLFGLLFAGGASLVLYRIMMSSSSKGPAADAQPVCIAAHDIEAGKVVKDEDLALIPWPGPLPATAIRTKREGTGRAVSAKIYKNEPVLGDRLAASGVGAGLAAMIPAGMRAVAVKVNEVVGLAGFAVPGTHVDVISSGNQAVAGVTTSGGTISRTILQDITVLSAGQDFKQDVDGKPISVEVVNLLVTPHQAELLSLAGSQTTIQLVLRNGLDNEKIETSGVALSSLLGNSAPAVAIPEVRAARQPVTAVRVAASPLAPPAPVQAPVPVPVPVGSNVEIISGTKLTMIGITPDGAGRHEDAKRPEAVKSPGEIKRPEETQK